MEAQNESKPTKSNAIYKLFYAFKMRFNKWVDKK
jgi:hypothetical protein